MRIKQINPRGWYDIPGYDGKYQINYFGNVRRALKRGYKALHPYIKTTTGLSGMVNQRLLRQQGTISHWLNVIRTTKLFVLVM